MPRKSAQQAEFESLLEDRAAWQTSTRHLEARVAELTKEVHFLRELLLLMAHHQPPRPENTQIASKIRG